ncbi:grpE protein homolog 1, mitochondrial [Lingula anatina]|uniref:GrpE protein homolog 1, mitochondrial n=1 Tax=Lingula anatina TaxID=7574 RepID=A0A1S3J2Z9_LINAN|nr:grpE protein homolog 1, mitochondrial [Lingula anatina]|eukprot:XP_013404785.1 grpE protein homolog 1, mitochondrial [Lingula anatina]
MAATGMCSSISRRIFSSLRTSNGMFSSKNRLYPRFMSTTATDSESKPPEVAETTESNPQEHSALLEANAKLEKDLKELEDKYKRALAETENVRNRMQKQIHDAKIYSIQGFCKDLLDVADVLNKAGEVVPKDEIHNENPHLKNLYEGVILTEKEMLTVFRRHGLEQIAPKEGDKFDPFLHDAQFQIPVPNMEPGTIGAIMKIGYKLHDRTIRPALVGVVKE